MADRLEFESAVVRRYPAGEPGEMVLFDASATVKWLVRAAADGAAAQQLGVPFGSSARAPGGALVLGSRPGEWILLGTAESVAHAVGALDGVVGEDFVTALDWTHGRALFRLTGHDAVRILEKVCSLDWSEEMTPDGAVMSASVAKVTCDLAREDVDAVPSYLIFCDRSFGQYLFDALIDAGGEFGLSVGPVCL